MSRRALFQGGIAGVLAAGGLTAFEIYQADMSIRTRLNLSGSISRYRPAASNWRE